MNNKTFNFPLGEPSRHISHRTTLFLYTKAGGRCEFDGCNQYLLEHTVTEDPGNFGERAHIYPFKKGEARGDETGRPEDIHDISNFILLCATCHHEIDKVRPQAFTVEVLKKFKKDHEDRVYELTDLSKDRDTVPVVCRGLVKGRKMDVSDEEMQRAVAPNYLKRRDKVDIDLSALPDSADSSYWSSTRSMIDVGMDRLGRLQTRPGRPLRVSVFAIAPIPSLIYLGSKLSDKLVVEPYQRHRNPETWTWKEGLATASYATMKLVSGSSGGPVVLLVNLSGKNPTSLIPSDLGEDKTVYELTLKDQLPTPLFLNTRADLELFTVEYIRALAMIRDVHAGLERIHLLPAVPAPVAVVLGRSRLPKVDPKLLVYDRDERAGGFVPTLEIS